MLKLVLTGVWVAIVALGAVYFSIEMSQPPDPAVEEAKKKAIQEFVRGELTTFPVIQGGKVDGYFLTRTSYIADKTKLTEITLPVVPIITDELYTVLVGDRIIRIGDRRNFDLAGFKEKLKKTINHRLGSDVVMDVVIEQIDYISKDALQADPEKAGESAKKIAHEKLPEGFEEDAAKEGGH